eukprot:SAG22_NODE_281_length_13064_cov_13.367605_2_plen_243_part_00
MPPKKKPAGKNTLGANRKDTSRGLSSSDAQNAAMQRSLDEKYGGDATLLDGNKDTRKHVKLGSNSSRNADGLIIEQHAAGVRGSRATERSTRAIQMKNSEDHELHEFRRLRTEIGKEESAAQKTGKNGAIVMSNPLNDFLDDEEDDVVASSGCCGGKEKPPPKKKGAAKNLASPKKLTSVDRSASMSSSADAGSIKKQITVKHTSKHEDIDLDSVIHTRDLTKYVAPKKVVKKMSAFDKMDL